MALPTNLTRIWVRGRFIIGAGDPLTGVVRFVPNAPVLVDPAEKVIIAQSGVGVALDSSGAFAVQLIATDDPDVSPTGFTYLVTEPTGRADYNISLPVSTLVLNSPGDPLDGQQVVELTEVTLVPGSPGGVGQVVKVGIASMTSNGSGDLVVTMTDGTVQTVVGPFAATHAGLPDLATSGHPATQVSLDPTGLDHVQGSSVTIPAALDDLDAAISAAYQHANLLDIASSGHPAAAIAVDKSAFTHILTADSQLQQSLNSIDSQLGSTGQNAFARKTADQSVTSSTTFVDDNALAGAVLASGVYMVLGSIIVDGSTAGDLKHQFTAPSGATFDWTSYGQSSAATAANGTVDQAARSLAGSVTHGLIGAGSKIVVRIQGLLVVSATPGTLQYRWAQNTSDATATTVYAGSFLSLQKVN